MSLGQLLADDVNRALELGSQSGRQKLLLWFDPGSEWVRPLLAAKPLLGVGSTTLINVDRDTSKVATKLELLSRDIDKPCIVHLAGWTTDDLKPMGYANPDLWTLVDYAYTGTVWAGTDGANGGPIVDWLEQHAIRIAGGAAARKRLTTGGRDSRLSKWLAREIGRDEADVPVPLRETDVAEVLGGDPSAAIRDLLLDPGLALAAWAADREEVLDRMRERFGLRLDPAHDAEGLAASASLDLALVEAWDAFGRPSDFPFGARLPKSDAQRSASIALVRKDLLTRGDVGAALLRRVAPQELGLHELAAWSATHDGQPRVMPHLVHARWLLEIERLATSAGHGWRKAIESVTDSVSTVRDQMSVPGVPDTSWAGVRLMRSVLVGARDAIAACGSIAVENDVPKYVDDWWRIDADYLAFRRAADRHPALSRLRGVVDEAYSEYLETTSRRWTDRLESDPAWTPPLPNVSSIASEVWEAPGGNRATLVIDALRWDIAKMIQEGLGTESRLVPVLSTLPSTTPFGMSALLPLNGPPTVKFGDKGVSLNVGGDEISGRAGRKHFLESWFNARHRSVAFLELDDVVQGRKLPKADHLVVFNYALDQTGHAIATAANLPLEAEAMAGRIGLAIRELHRAKISKVDVITDHGFLYVDPATVNVLGRPSIAKANAYNAGPRYAVLKTDAPAPDLIRVAAPLVPGSYVAVPRGIRQLQQANLYEHGGISLQECVIPHLVSESKVGIQQLGVEVKPSSMQVHGGTVAVTIRPSGDLAMPWSAPARRRLKLWLETDGPGSDPVTISDELLCDVRSDSPELRQALYLHEGLDLQSGTQVRLRVRDVDTLADLSPSVLTLLVDWD